MKIAIISAMEKEFEFVSKCCSSKGHTLYPAISGIAKVNAAITALQMIIDKRPDCIINTGVAGGLGNNVRMGDVVIGAENAYHDVWCGEGYDGGQVQGLPTRFPADPELLAKASQIKLDTPVHTGLICSGDQFLLTHESEEKILKLFLDALACDMESAAMAHVCFLKKVPFLSFRIISDTHSEGLGEEMYNDFWEHVSENSFNVVNSIIDSL